MKVSITWPPFGSCGDAKTNESVVLVVRQERDPPKVSIEVCPSREFSHDVYIASVFLGIGGLFCVAMQLCF